MLFVRNIKNFKNYLKVLTSDALRSIWFSVPRKSTLVVAPELYSG